MRARIMIFDEPTSSLTRRELELLMAMIRRLRNQGIGIMYVSHRMEEVFDLCDRVTVFRDGRYVATRDVAATSMGESGAHDRRARPRKSGRKGRGGHRAGGAGGASPLQARHAARHLVCAAARRDRRAVGAGRGRPDRTGADDLLRHAGGQGRGARRRQAVPWPQSAARHLRRHRVGARGSQGTGPGDQPAGDVQHLHGAPGQPDAARSPQRRQGTPAGVRVCRAAGDPARPASSRRRCI